MFRYSGIDPMDTHKRPHSGMDNRLERLDQHKSLDKQ
jgi:hypothetical protein